MALVTQASPEFYGAVFGALRNTAPRSQSVAATLDDLIDHLTEDEAEQLPSAIGEVLPLLRADPDRLRFAAEIAARLDFHEAAGAVADLAIGISDRELLLTGATLCGHPAVPASIRARVASQIKHHPAGWIRLDENAVPATADQVRLRLQRWPGARTPDTGLGLAPVVVLDQAHDARALLRMALNLDRAGAVIRRLPKDSPVPFWFGSQTVLICQPPTRSRVLSSYPQFPEGQILTDPLPTADWELSRLLRKIDTALPSSHRLRLTALRSEVPTHVWDPEVFTAGVYQTREVSFLSGAKPGILYSLRKQGLIAPHGSRALRWGFATLVAVRTWMYLKSAAQHPRRVSKSIVPLLARFAGDSEAVQLGVTSEGGVFVDRGSGWVDLESGQLTLDLPITNVDEAFRPFSFGAGTTVDLLTATPNTRLNPTVLHGTPYLKGHRISAKSLAGLNKRGGHEAIITAYPELQDSYFEDTVDIGHRLLGMR